MKRNILEEVTNKKIVNRYESHYGFDLKINEYIVFLKQQNEDKLEYLIKGFSVLAIADLERLTKYVCKYFIDNDSKYLNNYLVSLNKSTANFKFEVEWLSYIKSESVTIGDLISHQLKVNSIENILIQLDYLCNKEFVELMLSIPVKYFRAYRISKPETRSIILRHISSLKELFELRHFSAHENRSIEIKLPKFISLLKSCMAFMRYMGILIDFHFDLDISESTYKQHLYLKRKIKEGNKRIVDYLESVIKGGKSVERNEENDFIINIVETWNKSANYIADSVNDIPVGASMRSYSHGMILIELNRFYLSFLKSHFISE